MPCYSPPMYEDSARVRDLEVDVRNLQDKNNFHEAIACMLMRFVYEDGEDWLLDELNYTEAGITRHQFTEWWKTHQAKDQARLKAEMISNLKTNIDSLSVEQLTKMVAILKNN